jgi:hypothetical protein
MVFMLLADAHVHIHPAFDTARLLHAAAVNVRREAARTGMPDATGCLLLAESAGTHAFAGLGALAGSPAGPPHMGGWTVHETGEAASLVLRHPSQAFPLLLCAGRQVATTDGLEVLALLTTKRFEEPLDLRAAIEAVHAAGAITVVPWGFGKWSLGRGRIVAETLRSAARPLFLGDNGGRGRGWPAHPLLRRGRDAGLPILPGSDPLPFPGQERRAGSYGFVAPVDGDGPEPAARLAEWLRGLTVQPRTWGRRVPFHAFVRDQVRMQLRRRSIAPGAR